MSLSTLGYTKTVASILIVLSLSDCQHPQGEENQSVYGKAHMANNQDLPEFIGINLKVDLLSLINETV